jgi:hypothetical protein
MGEDGRPVSYVRWLNGTSTWIFDDYLLRLDNPNPVERPTRCRWKAR